MSKVNLKKQNHFDNDFLEENGEFDVNKYVEVKAIFQSEYDARKMANLLIDKNLIVTAHISSILSVYKKGKQKCTEDEIELSCVTKSDLYGIVKGFIDDNYPYECCQIISTPVLDISKDLLKWMKSQLAKR